MKIERHKNTFACLLKADASTNYIYVYSLHYGLMILSLSDLKRGEQLWVKDLLEWWKNLIRWSTTSQKKYHVKGT